MARRTVDTNQLTAGTIFMVRGKMSYSRIASQIAGEELAKDIAKHNKRGWYPVTTPYTQATISNAEILFKDPNSLSNEEIYAKESLYQKNNQSPAEGFYFRALNKGNRLPYIGVREPNSNVVNQINPEGELAVGLDVTLVLKVFQGNPNKGVSLEGIIVNEPIRYYNAGDGAGLAELGITFNRVDIPEQAPAENVAPAPQVNAMPQDTGQNPYPYTPPAQSNVMPPNIQQDIPQQGNAYTVQTNGPASFQQSVPGQDQNNPNAGIRYDPNSPNSNRNY